MASLTLPWPVNVDHARPTDDLLQRARQGEAAAFGLLCRDVEERLIRQAQLLTGPGDSAEVLARETLVEAWRALDRFDERCQFFTWLCAILLRRHRNSCRRRRLWERFFVSGQAASSGLEDAMTRWPDDAPGPLESLEQAERCSQVRRCLDRLPARQRDVVYMRFFVDHSLDSIALALGCSPGTVKSRLHHALERLRGMRELREMSAGKEIDHA